MYKCIRTAGMGLGRKERRGGGKEKKTWLRIPSF